jgi:hypothetical protein
MAVMATPLLLALCLLATPVRAAFFAGKYRSSQSDEFAFLGKFAFEENWELESKVSGNYTLQVWTEDPDSYMYLYDDESNEWAEIYDNPDCGCACATGDDPRHYKGRIPITPVGPEDRPFEYSISITDVVQRHWWYVVIAPGACGGTASGRFSLHFVHDDGSEFSADKRGLCVLYGTALVAWTVGLALHLKSVQGLRRRRLYHAVIQVYTLSILLAWAGIALEILHWATFAFDGVGMPIAGGAMGRMLFVLGKLVFLIDLLLIAKGWTVTSAELTERVPILIAAAAMASAYLVTAAWIELGRDEASVVYVYDTFPGRIVCTLHIVMGGWFLVRGFTSYCVENEVEKRTFFARVTAVYSPYFLHVPIIACIGILVDAPWRQVYMESAEVWSTTAFMAVLGFLFWPTRAAAYFKLSQDQMIGAAASYDDL